MTKNTQANHYHLDVNIEAMKPAGEIEYGTSIMQDHSHYHSASSVFREAGEIESFRDVFGTEPPQL